MGYAVAIIEENLLLRPGLGLSIYGRWQAKSHALKAGCVLWHYNIFLRHERIAGPDFILSIRLNSVNSNSGDTTLNY
jgi:hypothetical protein